MVDLISSAAHQQPDGLSESTSLSYSMNASAVHNNGKTSSEGLLSSERSPLVRRRRKDPVYVYKRSKMNVCNKICYGLGGAPYELTNTIIGFYISIFLLETAKVPPVYASVIVFLGRVWDGLSDPVVAYLVSRTRTRFGILKPWMFVGAPLAAVAYFCVWYVPETSNLGSRVIWYLLFYCAFQTFLTMPFGTYMLYVTDKQEERDSAEMFRMGIELAANVVGNIVMGISLSMFDARSTDGSTCSLNESVTVPPGTVELRIQAYMIGALSICVLFIICAIAVIFGTMEMNFETPFKIKRDEPFFAAVKRVLTFKPWLFHVGLFISFVMALQFIQGNFVLFSKYDVGMNSYQYAIAFVLISAFLFIPIWDYCRARFGKKTTLGCGMLQCFPLIITWAVMPYGLVWLQYLLSILMGSCLSVIHVAAWSMVPDVIDDFMVETKCSYETIFFTFYLMFIKFAAGLTLGFSNFILGVTSGYDTEACDHPESVLILRLLVTVLPGVGLIAGYFFLWMYPITEEVRNKNQTILELCKREESEEQSQTTLQKSVEFQRSLPPTKTFL